MVIEKFYVFNCFLIIKISREKWYAFGYRRQKKISLPYWHSRSYLSLLQMFVLYFEEDLLHWKDYYKCFALTHYVYWRPPD